MSKCHSAMFEGDSSIRNNVLHANDQFRQKYFHNHIFHWKSLLGRALRAIPFWSNKYASRTRTHFAMRPLFVFFPPCWLFGCRVDLRSFVSVVMFFFSADVVFVTLLKMKILVNVWNWFFSLTEFMSSHLRIPVICPVLIYARCPFVCAHKYIERIYKWGENGSSHQQAYTEQIEKEIAREREREGISKKRLN